MLVKESLPEDLPRIDKNKIAEPEKYWALYAVSFYERFFAKIHNKKKLKKAYSRKFREISSDKEAVGALNFFYRIRRDELDGIPIWESMLFESPDMIEARNIRQIFRNKNTLDLSDFQVPFGYFDGEMKVGKIMSTHPDMDKNYKDLPQVNRSNLKYAGRAWLKDRVISFWEYPETKEELYKVLKDLEKEFRKKFKKFWTINPKNWYIEIIDKKLPNMKDSSSDWMDWSDAEDAILIPVHEYEGSGEWSEEAKGKEHFQSPMNKEPKKVPDGVGSRKYGSHKPLAMRQAMSASENLVPSFREFLEL